MRSGCGCTECTLSCVTGMKNGMRFVSWNANRCCKAFCGCHLNVVPSACYSLQFVMITG